MITDPVPTLTLSEHVKRTLTLAVPVTISRISIYGLVVADTVMTGRTNVQELAFYGLAGGPLVPMLLLGIGITMGVVVLSAQSAGSGRLRECGQVWRLGVALAIVAGLLMTALAYAGEWFLLSTGQSPEMAAGASGTLIMLAWGLAPAFVFAACTFFLEGLNRPLPGMVVMLAANLLNVGFNWVFIYGNLGAQPMGAEGAALATTLTRCATALAMVGYVLWRLDRDIYGVLGPMPDARPLLGRLLRIGLPLALAHALESSSFAAMTLIAGLLGPVEVSAFTIGFNLIAIVFMCAIGLGTAASVRVANAIGRGDGPGVGTAGWTAVRMTVAMLSAAALVISVTTEPLANLYTSDPAVLAIAVPTIAVAALSLVPDGTQGCIGGALRGASDVWPATGLYLVSFWMVMVPLGYYLSIPLAMGAPGLMASVFAGASTAVLLLGWRFKVVAARARAPEATTG